MGKELNFFYDKEGDVLDISIDEPQDAISNEIEDDFFVRMNPKTKEIVGFSILNFEKYFSQGSDFKRVVPIEAKFEMSTTK